MNEAVELRDLAQVLGRITQPNRALVDRFLRDRQNSRIKVNTLRWNVRALEALDRHVNGKPFRDLTTDDARLLMAGLNRTIANPGTAQSTLGQIKTFLRWVNDGDLPKGFRVLLRYKIRDGPIQVRPVDEITPDEFALLMRALHRPRDKALLSVIHHTGMRLGEVLSLQVDSITFLPNGLMRLRLPFDQAEGLKTGPRDVYVSDEECQGVIKSLLVPDGGLHPHRDDGSWPLFWNFYHGKRHGRHHSESRGIRANAVYRILREAQEEAGVDRRIWPHLFRHSYVTRITRNRWRDADKKRQLGWSRWSRMPAYYEHLRDDDLQDQVLQDALQARRAKLRSQDPKPHAPLELNAASPTCGIDAGFVDCDWCAEPIKVAARKCKHCDELVPRWEAIPIQVRGLGGNDG